MRGWEGQPEATVQKGEDCVIIIMNGERQIYHPQNPNLSLINPQLMLEDNGAGNLTFQIYKDNLNYNTVRKLYPVLSVIRDDEIIFKGRVISDKKDFHNGKRIEAEGKLSFLNDSYLEPFSFAGSPEELFRMIIENHNAKVMDWQKFIVGKVTVADSNDYIVRSSESMLNSWTALKEKCFQSSLGGHIRIRYEKDGDYIDWLADYDTVSAQHIEFAKNMLSISSEIDATETYTAIRPIGAEVNGARVDISSVNGGKNFLVNEEKAEEYGIIYAPESESTWTEVTLPENLLKKAEVKLHDSFSALRETYEIRAVDLHLTDTQIESLNIYEYVPVVSKPHGIDGKYLLYKAEIDITSPQKTMYYLGATKRTFSDSHAAVQYAPADVPQDVSAFRNDANYVSEEKAAEMLADYSKTEEVESIVGQYVDQIPAGKDGENGLSAYEVAIQNGFNGDETEWLESLKGEDGKDGVDGASPLIGENGNWFISGTDTQKPSRGEAATIKIGEVVTAEPEESASVENIGTDSDVILKFVIPRGEKGKAGNSGGSGDSNLGLFVFEIREDGYLWMFSDAEIQSDNFRIDGDGCLIYKVGD